MIRALALALFLFFAAHAAASGARSEVRVGELPSEAQATLALIRRGGPFPYPKDATTFGNREGYLPSARRGYYREYTVSTPGRHDRGARRIIEGGAGEYYYTEDHYRTFRRILD